MGPMGPTSSWRPFGPANTITVLTIQRLTHYLRVNTIQRLTHYPTANTLSNGWIAC